jgi:hypothetical protein
MKYYFLCGLPRAGNTLFASLMNQNPDIKVTANGPTAEMYLRISKLKTDELLGNFPDFKSLDNVMENILPSYYKDWNCKYIIDRQAWGHDTLLSQLKKHLKNDIKIICLLRPLEQVLASFIKISKTTKENFVLNGGDSVEKQCDYLMQENGMIDLQLKSIKNLLKFENRGIAHFVEYDDLVNNTKKTLDGVYDFLGIDKFVHSFKGFNQLNVNGMMYDDTMYGVDLHKIRTNSVKKNNYSIEDYLPKQIIDKAKTMNFWDDRY